MGGLDKALSIQPQTLIFQLDAKNGWEIDARRLRDIKVEGILYSGHI